MKIPIRLVVFLALFSFFLIGCSQTADPVSTGNVNSMDKKQGQTIVQIAAGDTNFTYLVAAVQFAGLDDELNGNRQFTVFAPVNQAFLDLAASLNITVTELLTEPYRDLVTNVLLYHVSPGRKTSQNVVKSGKVITLLEQFAYTKIENGMAKIGNDTNGYANITAVDIPASNGVIHVIDKVLVPVLP